MPVCDGFAESHSGIQDGPSAELGSGDGDSLFSVLGMGEAPAVTARSAVTTRSAGERCHTSRPRNRTRTFLAASVIITLAAAASACGSSSTPASNAAPVVRNRVDAAGITWLCRPGLVADPCAGSLTTTVVSPSGTRRTVRRQAAANPPIDCFYVYPTVSTEKTGNASLAVQAAETGVANAQAAQFSRDCRVYAPMYRQATLASLVGQSTTPVQPNEAYENVLAAWRDYLAHYNDNRGFVLIGHSQGAFILKQLIAQVIEKTPSVRRRLVSAILLGGNVTVPDGKTVGGTFSNVSACRSPSQTGCVLAYSTFAANAPPPPNSVFARTSTPGHHVLCTNPAALGGGTGTLRADVPTELRGLAGVIGSGIAPLVPDVHTPWVSWPEQFRAECVSAGGATWLSVAAEAPSAKSVLDQLAHVLPPTWGLHLVDVNLALGNLVSVVADQSTHYLRTSR